MPLFELTPAADAVSVQGVEFRADASGRFALPSNQAIFEALASHGFTLTEVEPLEHELEFVDQAAALAARDAEIEALKAQIAELQAKPAPEAALVKPEPAEPPKKPKQPAKAGAAE